MVEAAPATAIRRRGPLAAPKAVSYGLKPAMTRLLVRGDAAAVRRVGQIFGVDPSHTALRATVAGNRSALWLGPDEWLLLAPELAGLAQAVEMGLNGEPGSVVDVSFRQLGVEVAGPGATTLLAVGCPLDLDETAFPVGMCTRTIFNKCEIVLWRQEPERFHIEVWRSFAPYLFGLLKQAANDSAY